MRIEKIEITKEDYNKTGINPISLKKKGFGHLIGVIGKNGSGKSRLLNIIKNYVDTLSIKDLLTYYSLPKDIVSQINALNQGTYSTPANTSPHQARVAIELSIRNKIKKYIKYFNYSTILTIPQKLSLNKLLQGQIDGVTVDQNEITSLDLNSSISHIRDVAMKITNDNFLRFLGQNAEKIEAESQLEKLNFYLKGFLGKEFTYSVVPNGGTFDVSLTFDNRPFILDELSPGQQLLYRYAMLFYMHDVSSKVSIKDSIIILDEPETHLHPSAQIQLIDKLSELVKDNGQLWIATHSVSILSHIDYDQILLIKDGNIEIPSRKNHSHALSELTGGLIAHQRELESFFISINEWQYANYMIQCFKDPDIIVGTNPDDKQYLMLKDFLSSAEKINVLDFGAGKGRIGITLFEDTSLKNRIEYSAFELKDDNIEYLSELKFIKSIVENPIEIIENEYDVVILCNVLHEINTSEWINTLQTIKKSLKEHGVLIFMEDLEIPKGEFIDGNGYILLNIEEFKTLNNSPTIFTVNIKLESDFNERLIACSINKNDINPTLKSQIDSIKHVNKRSYEQIKAIRQKGQSITQVEARLYAFYTHQYINTKMFLDDNPELI